MWMLCAGHRETREEKKKRRGQNTKSTALYQRESTRHNRSKRGTCKAWTQPPPPLLILSKLKYPFFFCLIMMKEKALGGLPCSAGSRHDIPEQRACDSWSAQTWSPSLAGSQSVQAHQPAGLDSALEPDECVLHGKKKKEAESGSKTTMSPRRRGRAQLGGMSGLLHF